ncbi:MAG TPA: ABC transporter permease [Terriglobales bacterium]|nr:ABC transporter permease [Terriglobales bacterium]HUL14968.1 ABC transporter permease [Terriglobales bacterium]
MYTLARNFRFALRQLGKTPGFTLTVVLTLALGIGATTAIFSLVEGVLLRPLPFRNADRLVLLGDHLGRNPGISVTAREIETYSNSTQAFSSMGGYISSLYELSGGAEPEEINAARVSAGTFPTLGVHPLLGRVFTPQEEDAHQPLAVISYSLWLNRFHRDPRVIGSSIDLDRKTYSIIGIMPRGFEFPLQAGLLDQSQLWIPLSLTPEELSDQHAGFWGYHMVARLKDGVTLPQAAQDTDRVAHQIMREFPANQAAIHIRGDVFALRDFLVEGVRPILRTLFFAVAIVLLIACANVSGLLLVRAIRRRREYAVRLALGARSGAILREAIVEGLVLSVVGGLVGLAFAAIAIRTSLHLLPDSMPRIDSISLDGTVAAFALLLALATGVLCSLAPAFAALRTDLNESLKEGGRTGVGASSHAWLRSALVVAEVAIALVLLTVSTAFLRSYQRMRAVDPGFRSDHVLVASYQLPLRQYSTDLAVDTFNRAAVDRLSSQPGVLAVGITNSLPATDNSPMGAYTIEGVAAENWKLKFAAFAMIYGDYFQAMRIPLLDGRTFTPQDRADAPLVLIVNESMAKDCWPGQRAVGKRMHIGNPHKGLPWATVVGIVADTKLGSPDEPSGDQWYMPLEQPAILFGSAGSQELTQPAGGYFTLRSALPPEHMVETLRSSIAAIDPLLALQEVRPMNDVVKNIEAPRLFNTDLITAFALGALLLAMTGIYAVVAFSVSVRDQEIAIRIALGAQRSGIARLVLISGAKLALLGCAIGVLGSLAASGLVSSFLFGVSARDPLLNTLSVLLMLLIALLASALPAFRAARAEPIDSLRSI